MCVRELVWPVGPDPFLLCRDVFYLHPKIIRFDRSRSFSSTTRFRNVEDVGKSILSTLNMRWHGLGRMRGSRRWTTMGRGAPYTQTERRMDKALIAAVRVHWREVLVQFSSNRLN